MKDLYAVFHYANESVIVATFGELEFAERCAARHTAALGPDAQHEVFTVGVYTYQGPVSPKLMRISTNELLSRVV